MLRDGHLSIGGSRHPNKNKIPNLGGWKAGLCDPLKKRLGSHTPMQTHYLAQAAHSTKKRKRWLPIYGRKNEVNS